MKKCVLVSIILYVMSSACISQAVEKETDTVWLSELDLTKMTSMMLSIPTKGHPQADKSLKGEKLSIEGVEYEKGVGTSTTSVMYIALNKSAIRFTSFVGVDDYTEDPVASVKFKIYADGKLIFDSGVMKADDAAKKVDVDLKSIETLILKVLPTEDGFNNDYADWAMAKFEYNGTKPVAIDPPQEEEYILTPKPGPAPKINGPKVFGSRPGNPFIYRIPTTGKRPIKFSAKNLPSSMTLDAETGIITGSSPEKRGTHDIVFNAENPSGKDSRPFKLIVGNTLALTPSMGWNTWYTFYGGVSDELMRTAADAMVDSGMADFGYMYVNVDAYWQARADSERPRDDSGEVLPNEPMFSDMTDLAEYIHSKGLRAGLYGSPGTKDCGQGVGSYQHEQIDAQTFAKWGYDFLKYDLCSYIPMDNTRYEWMRPYALMGEVLKNVDRDIVYNICQYGFVDVAEWGEQVNAHSWRTTADIVSGTRYLDIGLKNAQLYEYAGPGHWNDPDYILIGVVGDAHKPSDPAKKTTLTPSEQYQYMSMWSLMASPLIFAGDMTRLDDFTMNVLCNCEVIDVNQDSLGKQGKIVDQTDDYFVMVKDLEDGSKAVGLFNISEFELDLSVSWKTLGLKGKHKIRDLWRQKDLGVSDSEYKANVPRHAVSLVRIWP